MNDNNRNNNDAPKFIAEAVGFFWLIGMLTVGSFGGFGSNKKQYKEDEYVQEVTTEEETTEYTSEEVTEEKIQNEEIESIDVQEEQEADLEEKEFLKNYSKEDLLNSYDEVSKKGDLFPDFESIKEYKAEDIKVITVKNKDSNEENSYFVTYIFGNNKKESEPEIIWLPFEDNKNLPEKWLPYYLDSGKIDKDKINSFVTSSTYQSIFNDNIHYYSYKSGNFYKDEYYEFYNTYWDYTLYEENISFIYRGSVCNDMLGAGTPYINIRSSVYQADESIHVPIKITKQDFEAVFNCEGNQVFTIEELKQMEDKLNKKVTVKVYEQ